MTMCSVEGMGVFRRREGTGENETSDRFYLLPEKGRSPSLYKRRKNSLRFIQGTVILSS